jgi:hypothetical protein
VDQILLGAKISFGCLDRRVTEEQLDLVKLPSRGTAEFGTGPSKVMRSNARNTGGRCVLLKQLPDDFLAHAFTLDLIPSVDWAECESIS